MARGKLVFKGEEKAKKKKRKTKTKSGDEEPPAAVAHGSGSSVEQLGASIEPPPPQGVASAAKGGAGEGGQEQGPQIKSGRGLISTSGTVVQGHGTAFQKEIRAGDAILARAANGAEEMRVVKMTLSNVSISISSAFSSDLKTPTPFSYICKPRDDRKEKAAKAQKALQDKEEVESRAMGTYGNKGEIVYREKTSQGSYRIRKEQATTEMSRSDLLSFRAKKKSDRYC